MSHRPYPNIDNALRQVGRHPQARKCPGCDHRVDSHAVEDGERVCTRGVGRISCRDCAELHARMPAVAAVTDLVRAFRTKPNTFHLPMLLGQR